MTRLAPWMVAGLVAATVGCATAQAKRARARELQAQLDAFRLQYPLDEVWQQARLLLIERGYPLAKADAEAAGQEPMSWAERLGSPARATSVGPPESDLLQMLGMTEKAKSDLQWLDTGWNGYGERYHVEALEDAGGCRVIFTHIKADRTDRRDERTRDPEMELDLVRRVDPEAASRIDAALGAPQQKKGG